MKKLIIEPTSNSPKVILDPELSRFEFSGESRPENVRDFYSPILEWLDEFSSELSKQKKPEKKTLREFIFNFEYFNSTSAKYILDIFKSLSLLHDAQKEILVKWHYEEDDVDMLEVGQEMSRMSKLPFDYVKVDVD
jgi:hypothetical protein